MNKKIVFLDIDGTLTEPGHNEPPASAIDAINQARSKGHYVFLCTGRNYNMLSPLLQYDFDGVIASSGGYIEYQKKVIYDSPLTQEQKQRAIKVLDEHGIFKTIECKNGSYTDEGFKEFLRSHESEGSNSEFLRWREQVEKSLNILPMKEYEGQPIYKMVIMSPTKEKLLQSQQILSDELDFCIQEEDAAGFTNGEVLSKLFNKGKAVEKVCEYLKIPISDSIGIGDSMNDKEMLETVGLSICMENGSEELKKIADEVCPSVSEHGIWKAFYKHHII